MDQRNPQRQGNLTPPLVIVAIGPTELFLMEEAESYDADMDAQMYELDQEAMFDQIKPLALWLKFMYGLEAIEPPIPFTEDTRRLHVEKYKAAKRAREAAGNVNNV